MKRPHNGTPKRKEKTNETRTEHKRKENRRRLRADGKWCCSVQVANQLVTVISVWVCCAGMLANFDVYSFFCLGLNCFGSLIISLTCYFLFSLFCLSPTRCSWYLFLLNISCPLFSLFMKFFFYFYFFPLMHTCPGIRNNNNIFHALVVQLEEKHEKKRPISK